MRLTELNPQWLRAGGSNIYNADGTPAEEREGIGIGFDCPCDKCTKLRNESNPEHELGRHFIIFTNPLDNKGIWNSEQAKWNRIGDTFDTLQLTPSILSDPAKGGCGWHGYIGRLIPGEVTTE